MKPLFPAAVLTLATCACASAEPSEDAVARGRTLFESGALSASSRNLFRCSTCHDAGAQSGLAKPGASMAGVTLRPSFWGGEQNDLLHAIDACRTTFMYAAAPLRPGERDADALYDYLASLAPTYPDPVPFTVVDTIAGVERGDAERGKSAFSASCAPCHGALHSGENRLSESIPILPEDTLAEHPAPSYSPRVQRLVFIEKTRHGVFFGYGGDMPPFSLEVLPDAALADVLEALGVTGS